MSTTKRPRAAFEADLQALQSPYTFYGTPLPPLDPDARDDGSYVPVWKQTVTDERGRKRLHGAFTGGFSAGYFNTVGSKEGWTPASFVSSRTSRNKAPQRAEDFMDDEDLADAEEARKLQTAGGFAALGSTTAQNTDSDGLDGLARLVRGEEDSVGARLLRRMGWRPGQGIGARVRRRARVGDGGEERHDDGVESRDTHFFAPENTRLIAFTRKTDHKGLGYSGGEARLAPLSGDGTSSVRKSGGGRVVRRLAGSDSESDGASGPTLKRLGGETSNGAGKKAGPKRGAFGVGILNDTGSDEDEDPYDIGPRLGTYNRSIGLGKDNSKKGKRAAGGLAPNRTLANPLLASQPVFLKSRKFAATTGPSVTRKCRDGRLPLDGFVLALRPPPVDEAKYPPPKVPAGWVSAKRAPEAGPTVAPSSSATAGPSPNNSHHTSLKDAARASAQTPSSRAAALGEIPLPGKSVFDFLTPAARARLAAASGRADLPPALSEPAPQSSPSSGPDGGVSNRDENPDVEVDEDAAALARAPPLSPRTASAALSRLSASATANPYARTDPGKARRYAGYLAFRAGRDVAAPGFAVFLASTSAAAGAAAGGETKAGARRSTQDDDALRARTSFAAELAEFAATARVFRPATGMIAKRFVPSTSASASAPASASTSTPTPLLTAPAADATAPDAAPADPALAAARAGAFGPLTRTRTRWNPPRLLCKRLGVKPPERADVDEGGAEGGWEALGREVREREEAALAAAGGARAEERRPGAGPAVEAEAEAEVEVEEGGPAEARAGVGVGAGAGAGAGKGHARVDVERNEAVEGERPDMALFRAVFGDDEDEDDSDDD